MALLDKPSRQSLIFRLLHRNRTLRLMYYWIEDFPPGSLPASEQVALWQDTRQKVAAITGRKVAKTIFVESLVICSAFDNLANLEEENLFSAPGDVHMAPVLNRIESRILRTPLFRALYKSYNKNDGILEFRSHVLWYFRIEGLDDSGRNMVGIRAKRIICDESSFGGQKSHDARIQVALDPLKTTWHYFGVPNGVRLTPFWRIDQDPSYGAEWSIHRMASFINPKMRTPEARQSLIDAYGGENAQEYLNNVLGQWGEERGSTFPSSHLALSQSMTQPYFVLDISDTQAMKARAELKESKIPWRKLLGQVAQKASIVGMSARASILGIDHGFSPDPTVCYIAYLHSQDTDLAGEEIWRLLGNINLYRITASEHADFIDMLRSLINDSFGGPCLGIVADMMGYAKATYTDYLFSDPRFDVAWYNEHVLSANFGGTDIAKDEFGNTIKDTEGQYVKKGRKQTSTELLKEYFAANVRDLKHQVDFLT